MSGGVGPAAQPLPVDRATRMVLYAVDVDFDGKVGAGDGARSTESRAVLALAGSATELDFSQLQGWVARYDVANRLGLPGQDGALDQGELGRLVLDIRQMVEHQNPRLSADIATLGASLLRQVDGNRDGRVTSADTALAARALLRLAGNPAQLDQAGINSLLARYDQFDAANRRPGPDGKIGPLEMEAFNADLQAAAGSLPPAGGLTDEPTAGDGRTDTPAMSGDCCD